MARLRVVVEMNKGRIGVPLHKLAAVVKETETFFKMLAEDVKLPGDGRQWLGLNFQSGSVTFTAEYIPQVEPSKIAEFNNTFDHVRRGKPLSHVRTASRHQYAKIAEHLDEDESIAFGIYERPDSQTLEFVSLSKLDLSTIVGEIQGLVESSGSIQGTIHSLFIGSHPPHFFVRELSTDNLIKCTYPAALYPDLANALQREAAILHIHGTIKINKDERKIEHLRVQRIEQADILSDLEFNEFFGCSQNLTGILTTQEFIDRIRDRDA